LACIKKNPPKSGDGRAQRVRSEQQAKNEFICGQRVCLHSAFSSISECAFQVNAPLHSRHSHTSHTVERKPVERTYEDRRDGGWSHTSHSNYVMFIYYHSKIRFVLYSMKVAFERVGSACMPLRLYASMHQCLNASMHLCPCACVLVCLCASVSASRRARRPPSSSPSAS
jgi:hypothetical protein